MVKPVEPQIIGEHIRRLRLKRHVSVRAFAAQTGFSPSFISQLENGQEDLIVRTSERRRLDSTWTLGDEESKLRPGDAVTLPAHAPHRWENRGRETVEVLMISSRVQG